MNPQIGTYVIDNDENIYKIVARKDFGDYSELVAELMGEWAGIGYAVFYRSNWAWLDRENPDFKLMEEVEYYPGLV